MRVNVTGLDEVIAKLTRYKTELEAKKKMFLERLAGVGINTADIVFRNAIYDGTNDVVVNPSPEWIDENRLRVVASGKSILFIEFGSGPHGGGHPQTGEFGYGPGTWSEGPNGKGHWKDPGGWYYAHGLKSTGNPPARAMYRAAERMRREIRTIAREVFGGND